MPLLLLLTAMLAVGLVILVSASYPDANWIGFQVIRIVVAVVAMLVIAQLPVAMIRRGARWCYRLAHEPGAGSCVANIAGRLVHNSVSCTRPYAL